MSAFAKKRVAPTGPAQPPACACGVAPAPFGLGPPLVALQAWFCAVCWMFQPSTQLQLAERCRAALQEEGL